MFFRQLNLWIWIYFKHFEALWAEFNCHLQFSRITLFDVPTLTWKKFQISDRTRYCQSATTRFISVLATHRCIGQSCIISSINEITPMFIKYNLEIIFHIPYFPSSYTKLLRPSDDKVYGRNEFNDLRLQNFKFFIITRNPFPPLELLSSMYPIRIHIPA